MTTAEVVWASLLLTGCGWSWLLIGISWTAWQDRRKKQKK